MGRSGGTRLAFVSEMCERGGHRPLLAIEAVMKPSTVWRFKPNRAEPVEVTVTIGGWPMTDQPIVLEPGEELIVALGHETRELTVYERSLWEQHIPATTMEAKL